MHQSQSRTRSIIRELVELCLISERLMGRGEFKLSEFKGFDEPYMMVAYVDDVLKKLGEGTSRVTYLLSSGKALKIARPNNEDKGRAQNQAELDFFTSPKTKPIVARVFDYDPNYNWLISELVRPISDDEFKTHVGLSTDSMFPIVDGMIDNELSIDDYLEERPKLKRVLKPHTKRFIQSCVDLHTEHGILIGDVVRADHWGKTPDGRIVLLDYGFTSEVSAKHYTEEEPTPSPSASTKPWANDITSHPSSPTRSTHARSS